MNLIPVCVCVCVGGGGGGAYSLFVSCVIYVESVMTWRSKEADEGKGQNLKGRISGGMAV